MMISQSCHLKEKKEREREREREKEKRNITMRSFKLILAYPISIPLMNGVFALII